MKCSPARLAANRANSLKSTGPLDTSRTRFNGLKHGLTAAVALPGEDQAAIQATLDNLVRDYEPRTEEELILVEDAAFLATRLRRHRRHDDAMLSTRTRHAVEDFHGARVDALNAAIDGLGREPERALERLRSDPDGLDWMVEQWEELRERLVESRGGTIGVHGDVDAFDVDQMALMVRLLGRPSDGDKSREEKLHEAFGGYFGNLDMLDRDAVPDDAKIEWARGLLLGMIDRELAEVRQIRDAFDVTDLKRDQDEAVHRALFDPSKEAILARRYEAATRRELKRTFRDLKELAATRAEAAEGSPEIALENEVAPKSRGSMASLCQIRGAAFEAEQGRPISVPEGPPGVVPGVVKGRPEAEEAAIPPRIE